MPRVTVTTLRDFKSRGEKISMITAYDYPSAMIAHEAGIDTILVGDSLGMALLGYDTTLPVTMDVMIHHTKAVTRGSGDCMVIGDMPFLSYHLTREQAVANAGRFLQEGGAHAVKLEGGQERLEIIEAIIAAGIPVLGHIGLTPQSVHQMGGYKVQGKGREQAQKLLSDAKHLAEVGVFGLVLECVPAPLADLITKSISIPTIGIGAGPSCDGQVLVWHDLMGITQNMKPKFVKRYADMYSEMLQALKEYKEDVKQGTFPAEEHTFAMKEEDIPKVY